MRRVLPVLALLAIAAACRSTPDEPASTAATASPTSAPASSASSSSVPAASSASDEDAGPANLRTFCEGAFTADTDRLRAKCSAADLALSQSMAKAAANLCSSNLALAIARSRATFDDDAGRRCVDMLKQKELSRTSETDTLFQHPPCDRILVGLQPEGQPCRFSIECKEGLACVGYKVGADGMCKKPPAAAQACTLQPYGTIFNEAAVQPHHPPCGPGAYCDGTTCQPRIATGKACSTSDACPAGASCVQGKCGPRAAAGGACTAGNDCAFGLWCDRSGDGGQGKCAAKRAEGQECGGTETCKGRCDVPRGKDNRP
ncbi:MAG TPA: hypothetical protein VIF09_08135, partial [Polyangiaceae bacterium]